jgi:hypothetical protein
MFLDVIDHSIMRSSEKQQDQPDQITSSLHLHFTPEEQQLDQLLGLTLPHNTINYPGKSSEVDNISEQVKNFHGK